MNLRSYRAIFVLLVLALLVIALIKTNKSSLPQKISTLTGVSIGKKNTATAGSETKTLPAQILNLQNWKLTLPTGSSEEPTTIKQPDLSNFVMAPWFTISSDANAVVFRAAVNGVTTENSNYPRSELREMTSSGRQEASWSSTTGKHTMTIDESITAIPRNKNQVVAGQIHDADDDVIVIRLDYPKLYINVSGKNKATLDSSYRLGKRFTVKFEVEGGKTNVYYNNSPAPSYTLPLSYSGAYFKAGAYTQSNCDREGQSTLCNEGNYGEVSIYRLSTTHQ